MSKKLLSVSVTGARKTWVFHFYADPKHLPEWRADGLEIEEVRNTIPEWLPWWFPVDVWCFVQDLLNFRNPFK